MTNPMGVIARDGQGRGTAHFERRFDISPAELWPYLTEAGHLSAWITPRVIFEPMIGGRVQFAWPAGPPVEGRVLVFEPPRLLEYEWHEGAADTIVRMELLRDADGTLLVVDHSGLPVAEAAGFGAGWHAHLDWLEHELHEPGAAFDQEARFRELAPVYGYEIKPSAATQSG